MASHSRHLRLRLHTDPWSDTYKRSTAGPYLRLSLRMEVSGDLAHTNDQISSVLSRHTVLSTRTALTLAANKFWSARESNPQPWTGYGCTEYHQAAACGSLVDLCLTSSREDLRSRSDWTSHDHASTASVGSPYAWQQTESAEHRECSPGLTYLKKKIP